MSRKEKKVGSKVKYEHTGWKSPCSKCCDLCRPLIFGEAGGGKGWEVANLVMPDSLGSPPKNVARANWKVGQPNQVQGDSPATRQNSSRPSHQLHPPRPSQSPKSSIHQNPQKDGPNGDLLPNAGNHVCLDDVPHHSCQHSLPIF